MGLAFPSLSGAYSSSFMLTVNSQGTAAYPYFAMRLNNNGPSEMTFGSYNRARSASGSPRWYDLGMDSGTYTYWQFALSAPWVNGHSALATLANHIIDSGTTLIVAPPSSAAEFWSHVPGSAVYNSNFWTFVRWDELASLFCGAGLIYPLGTALRFASSSRLRLLSHHPPALGRIARWSAPPHISSVPQDPPC